MTGDPDGGASTAGGEVDALYGVDPSEFVAARNELVRRLKAAGDREGAAAVAGLRRPTPAAWAVNQLVRRDRAGVETLARRGEELRAAQDRALAGAHADDLREASRSRRDAVAALVDAGVRLLAERGVAADPHRHQLEATLEAASLDARAAAAVLEGRLATALQPPSGFGDAGGGGGGAPARPAPERGESPDAEARAAAEARRLARGLAAQARTLGERAARRRREVEEADAEVASMERRLAEARRRRDEADRDAREAEAAAAEAEAASSAAAARLEAGTATRRGEGRR